MNNVSHPWYLYTLSHKNIVFYVGISHNLINRYKSHCGGNCELSYNTIHWIKQAGELPELNIVNQYWTIRDAEIAETALILHFVSINHKLRNSDLNQIYNKLIDCIPMKDCNDTVRMKRKYADSVVKTAFDKFNKSLCRQII